MAAGVSAAVLFIYARLLGRLAWIIQRLPSPQRAPAKAKVQQGPQPRRKKKRKPSSDVQDPWAIPEEEERAHKAKKQFPWAKESPGQPKPGYHVPSAEEIEGYGFAAEKPTAPEPKSEKPTHSRFAMTPDEYERYDVRDTTEPQPPTPREPQDDLFAEQVRHHVAERTRVKPTLPPHQFFTGVYSFPFYSACLPNWLALSFAFLAEGGILHQLIAFGSELFH